MRAGKKTFNDNVKKRFQKIQEQFKERLKERNARGARPNVDDVMEGLATDWCLSKRRIEQIIRMKIDE